jgi:hypothetical protein
MRSGSTRQPRRWRWGLLTLLFLGVVLACVLVSNAHGSYTAVTGIGLLVGFAGAAYCTYRGIKDATWLPR